jgi:hypothetical protein
MELEIEALEAEHGLVGFAVYVKLLQEAYQKEDGELCMKQEGVSLWTLYARRWKMTPDKLKSILKTMISIGLFDKEIYKKDMILTSAGIKKRIEKIKKERERDRIRKGSGDSPEVFPSENSGKIEGAGAEKGETETKTEIGNETENSSTVKRDPANDTKELLEMQFVLRLHDQEFGDYEKDLLRMIIDENEHRTQKFVWKPTTGSFTTDVKSLIYKISDEKKTEILYNVYKINKEKLNWSLYVKNCIRITIRTSLKQAVRDPYKLTMYFILHPSNVVTEMTEGLLSKTITQIMQGAHKNA